MRTIKIFNENANLFNLKFKDNNLEKDFNIYYLARYLWQLRLAHILAIFFFLIAIISEYVLLPTQIKYAWLRYGIVISSFILGYFTTLLFPKFYKSYYQFFGFYYVITSGLSFILSSAFAPLPYAYTLYGGVIICLIFNYTFIRQSFIISSVGGLFLVVLYLGITNYRNSMNDYLAYTAVIIGVANLLGMFISYLIELDSKRGYLLLTQTKNDASKIMVSNINLEHEVQIRTSELKQAKLKAEESDRIKTEFLNNISHEIRTPMNGIIGFSNILNDPGTDKDQIQQYSELIKNCTHQLLKIIENILEISTLESNQVILRHETFSLNTLLKELVSSYELKTSAKKVKLELIDSVSSNTCIILSDKTILSRILNNLIENAIKFTRVGKIEVGYTIIPNSIDIFIKDTGIGIDMKHKDLVFRRFEREEKKMAQEFGGLGVGLAIAKENALLLGGNVTVSSIKGIGSTFHVILPYKPEGSASIKHRIPPLAEESI